MLLKTSTDQEIFSLLSYREFIPGVFSNLLNEINPSQKSHSSATKQFKSFVQIILGLCNVYFSCELDLTLSR